VIAFEAGTEDDVMVGGVDDGDDKLLSGDGVVFVWLQSASC
jgi:hypothetical protein